MPGERIWYFRELADEPQLPSDMPVLYEDEHVLAIDKPHFLPTTPRGSYIAQTALTKLRVREQNPLLIPIHRLDRPTAGVLLFAKTVQARRPFQMMFQHRQVSRLPCRGAGSRRPYRRRAGVECARFAGAFAYSEDS